MSTIKISQYIHFPNATELGMGNTHETYMLVSSDTNLSEMFPPKTEVDVIEISSKKIYKLKSTSGGEFRVNQMGDIYRDYKLLPGDKIIFSKVETEDDSKIFFSVKTFNRVVLVANSNGVELFNLNRLSVFSVDSNKFELKIYNEGVEQDVLIEFKESKKKRSDSPVTTDYYKVLINGNALANGKYVLTISDKSLLENFDKSDFNVIEYDDSILPGIDNHIKINKGINLQLNSPLQQIFYGAPGTGKSHGIKEKENKFSKVIRTTFHPDSDYSTFVGAYKPTMEECEIKVTPVVINNGISLDQNNGTYKEKRITYTFVKQAFLKAYIEAWNRHDKGENVLLVIEEINRGNCAQIFGDLFQLLDRNSEGYSDYPIQADEDIKMVLAEEFVKLDYMPENVKSGEELLLPNNLYIWATMNTSDQSLFPIDSAFKRRWDWQYMPIGKGYDENGEELIWAIEGETKMYSWWSFLEKINAQVGEATQSEDKKLGFFFCKATNGTISAEKFVGKVIFYLWNDVFKNNGFEESIFKDVDGTALSFGKFYKSDIKGNAIVQKDKVELFLNNLGVDEFITNDGEDNQEDSKAPNLYSLNGQGSYRVAEIWKPMLELYINKNVNESPEDIINEWNSKLTLSSKTLVLDSKNGTPSSYHYIEIDCRGQIIYCHNHWKISEFNKLVDKINKQDWDIRIEKL